MIAKRLCRSVIGRAGQPALLQQGVDDAVVLKEGGPGEVLDQHGRPERQEHEGQQDAPERRPGTPKAGRQHVRQDQRNRRRDQADDEGIRRRPQQEATAQHGQDMRAIVGGCEAHDERERNEGEDAIEEADRRQQPQAVAERRQCPTPPSLARVLREGTGHGVAGPRTRCRNTPFIARVDPRSRSRSLAGRMLVERCGKRHAAWLVASPRRVPD